MSEGVQLNEFAVESSVKTVLSFVVETPKNIQSAAIALSREFSDYEISLIDLTKTLNPTLSPTSPTQTPSRQPTTNPTQFVQPECFDTVGWKSPHNMTCSNYEEFSWCDGVNIKKFVEGEQF